MNSSEPKTTSVTAIIITICTVCGCFYFILADFVSPAIASLSKINSSSFGASDFLEYWSAFKIAQKGGNPYSPQQMLELQQQWGREAPPIMMWNPPWNLLLMSPVLGFSLPVSNTLWLILNLLMLSLIGTLLWRAMPERGNNKIIFSLATIIFAPAWNNLKLGQLGIFLTLCAMLFLWAEKKHKDFLSGAMLALLSIKPHLFLLFFTTAAWWIISSRRWRVAAGFMLTLVLLVLASQLIWPQATAAFISTALAPETVNGVNPVTNWFTATIPGAVIAYSPSSLKSLALALQLIIPSTAVLTVFWILIRRRPTINWAQALPPLLAASYIFAPFGWFFDQTLVLPLQLALAAHEKTANISVAVIFLYQLLTFGLMRSAEFQHQMFWFPLFLIICWYFRKQSNSGKVIK